MAIHDEECPVGTIVYASGFSEGSGSSIISAFVVHGNFGLYKLRQYDVLEISLCKSSGYRRGHAHV